MTMTMTMTANGFSQLVKVRRREIATRFALFRVSRPGTENSN